MHVVIVSDQHVESFGGAQVSMRLQARYLERAGHTVSFVMPRWARRAPAPVDERFLELPATPITRDREYAAVLPGRRADRALDAALAARPPVDLVHIQADFWGNAIGQRLAERLGVPRVVTLHNRLDVGIAAFAPAFGGLALRALNAALRLALRGGPGARVRGSDATAYFRRLVAGAAVVTAPSAHFARRLEVAGVAERVEVVWNGIDDELLDATLAERSAAPERAADEGSAAPSADAPPRLIWLGRFSPEKRLLPFLRALVDSGVRAEVEILGGGDLEAAARREAARAGGDTVIRFLGRRPYPESLARLAAADAVVQTSIGFETQGMTVFEAAALGTPAIMSDPDIAAELGACWAVPAADGEPARERELAATLRRAVEELASGRGVRPDPSIRERFRQSSRTAEMLRIYVAALGAERPGAPGAGAPDAGR
ncbi:MAG: glycosyltransferase [Actinomycetales bacterium]|nr:glycosyltransferase [Actinomycetales bacterium]